MTSHCPSSALDVRERDGSGEVVLLDTSVSPLLGRRVRGVPSACRDVHADHVPQVAL